MTTNDSNRERCTRYCIIMAGGVGSRFWPLSKDECPKQFLDILGTGKSFLRATFERFLPLVPAENFVVVTNAAYRDMVMQHLPEIDADQVLCEPMRRNTAPCIAYATYHVMARCADASVVVTPSDHLVINEVEFRRVIDMGMSFVEREANARSLMTIGIRPSHAETGYGYIELSPEDMRSDAPVLTVNFKEKPDRATAERFLAAGNYMWNSGIFIWRVQGIVEAMRSQLPEMVEVFEGGRHLFGTDEEQRFIDDNFGRCPNISIDYGVMEHAVVRHTIAADFGWSDLGTYGSLYAHTSHDGEGNSVSGSVVVDGCHGNVIKIDDGVRAVIQGMEDSIVVFHDGNLLVCRLSEEQRIKELVGRMES